MKTLGTPAEMGLTREAHAIAKMWHELSGALDLLADKYDDKKDPRAPYVRQLAEQTMCTLEGFLLIAKEQEQCVTA